MQSVIGCSAFVLLELANVVTSFQRTCWEGRTLYEQVTIFSMTCAGCTLLMLARHELYVHVSYPCCPQLFRTGLDRTSVDSGLGDVPPPVRFGGGLQCGDSNAIDGRESSPHVLLCDLPCLSVELSRLELVVLADILAGFAPPPEEMPVVSSSEDFSENDQTLPMELEVLVEARGATIVLHEAAAFAEDPGPHSFVLNLGNACLHLGRRDKSTEGCPTPLVTISSGDLCVHETLRHCCDDGEDGGGRGRITGPLLFLPGRNLSAHPLMDDLPTLGFVSILSALKYNQKNHILLR